MSEEKKKIYTLHDPDADLRFDEKMNQLVKQQEELAHNNMNGFMDFIFNGANVRVIAKENGIWFYGPDIAIILGYQSFHMYRMLQEYEKIVCNRNTIHNVDSIQDLNMINNMSNISSNRGNPNIVFISLSGLFRLIASSRRPEAMMFQNWVNGVVLPSIYNTGYYAAPNTREQIINNPKVLEEYNKKIAELEKQNEQYKKQIKSSNDIIRKHYEDIINARFMTQTQGNNLIKAVDDINIRIDTLSNAIEETLDNIC